jgi:hypothetical protein
MIIPDQIRKCVFFIGSINKDGEFAPLGTGLFLSRALPDTERVLILATTAWHVLVEAAKWSSDGMPYCRANLLEGGSQIFSMSLDSWDQGEDSSVDAAVASIRPREFGLEYVPFPVEAAATSEYLRQNNIGPGEDVFMAGLFSNMVGRDRNVPIIRTGTIAALPDERIHTQHFGDVEAVLVEVRSIGGFSGSPVFLNLGAIRQSGSSIRVGTTSGTDQFKLLGLMHGFESSSIEVTNPWEREDDLVNSGISIVVPVDKLIEIAYGLDIEEVMARGTSRRR